VSELSELLRVLLEPAAVRYGIDLGTSGRLLASYADRLLAWNQRINLTGARDLETLALEHIADAFPLVPHLAPSARCIDVGSGAGLPGIVLAIVRSDVVFTLLEPIQKRRTFLSAVVRDLGLARVTVLGDRLNAHVAGRGREAYDAAISRAVFPLAEWLELGRRLVCPGGAVLGFAGSREEAVPAGAARVPYDVGAGPRVIVVGR